MKRSREPEEPPPTLLMPLPSTSPSSVSLSPIDPRFPCASESGPAGYAAGTEAEQPRTKIASLSPAPDDADDREAEPAAMTCLLHRERMDFPSYEAYEAHYNKEHLNRCIECRRNFPSPMYLNLHGDEWHDPFVAVRREKGEHTYACFVEGCERKCGSMDKRRRHLIDKHGFPNNFFFLITQYGIDGRHSLLDDGARRWQHRRRPSAGNPNKIEVRRRSASGAMSGADDTARGPFSASDGNKIYSDGMSEPSRSIPSSPKQHNDNDDLPVERDKPDVQMDDLAGAMSAMTFIPRSIRFGRGGKAGFVRR